MKTKTFLQDRIRVIKLVNKGLMVFMALYFLVFPVLAVITQLFDPAVHKGGIPRSAVHLFKALTPRYEKWARERIASGNAGALTGADISGTEWPPFGSAFYLWAVESLQEEWDSGDHFMEPAPKVYARGAIEASTRLVIDKNTAAWVRKYWVGWDYLHHEDIFYRMLMISSATVYQKLTGDDHYLPLLRDQVETLSKEVDRSKFGLLDDYPYQCFPADVVAAVAAIRKADPLLGTDHSKFIQRAQRGFQGRLADERGLPPYFADSKGGVCWGPSRGCSNSYLCLFAPIAWHDGFGAMLYDCYDRYFWQERWGGAGFREFPKDIPGYDWYWDVDSGPVVAGHGISACAFGLGAARANGRMDHAYLLTAETLAFSWPLPDGTLLLPDLLSDATDAPLVGEASILYNLTRQPVPGATLVTGGSVPLVVYLVLLLFLTRSFFLFRSVWKDLRGSRTDKDRKPYPMFHFLIWGSLVVCLVAGMVTFHYLWAIIFYVIVQFFPLKVAHDRSRIS